MLLRPGRSQAPARLTTKQMGDPCGLPLMQPQKLMHSQPDSNALKLERTKSSPEHRLVLVRLCRVPREKRLCQFSAPMQGKAAAVRLAFGGLRRADGCKWEVVLEENHHCGGPLRKTPPNAAGQRSIHRATVECGAGISLALVPAQTFLSVPVQARVLVCVCVCTCCDVGLEHCLIGPAGQQPFGGLAGIRQHVTGCQCGPTSRTISIENWFICVRTCKSYAYENSAVKQPQLTRNHVPAALDHSTASCPACQLPFARVHKANYGPAE